MFIHVMYWWIVDMLSCMACSDEVSNSQYLRKRSFHSISAALGDSRSRSHADSRGLSIKHSLELSWQWRIVVFRCKAQIGESVFISNMDWTMVRLGSQAFVFDVVLTINYISSDTFLLDTFHYWYGHPQLFPKSPFTALIGRTTA